MSFSFSKTTVVENHDPNGFQGPKLQSPLDVVSVGRNSNSFLRLLNTKTVHNVATTM
jgi:hypothetical protein